MKQPVLRTLALLSVLLTITPASAQVHLSWTKTGAPALGWKSIAASADGTKLVAGQFNGPVHVSTNSGASWSATSLSAAMPSGSSHLVASSTNGQKLAVASSPNGFIILSTSADGGSTWATRKSISNPDGLIRWAGVACSADGTRLVAATRIASGQGGEVFTSTDSGVTWTLRFFGQSWGDVASSADGAKLVVVVGDLFGPASGNIYTSSDGGTNWASSPFNFDRVFTSVACSADGTKIFAAESSSLGSGAGRVHSSTNSGVTWDDYPGGLSSPFLNWSAISCSTNGDKVFATSGIIGPNGANHAGLIFSSTNAAKSWQLSYAPNDYWTSIATSGDGNKSFAGSGNAGVTGAIYAYNTPTTNAPVLGIATTGGNNLLSWPWPSEGFVLQQNTNVATPNWVAITNAPAVMNQIIVTPTNANLFYRLAKP